MMDIVTELAARTELIRAGHMESTGDVWQPRDWRERIHERFPTILKTPWGIECGSGWADLIIATCEMLSETPEPPVLTDVKEKFGRLRIYSRSVQDIDDDITDAAEVLSGHLCEQCGAPGKRRPGGWVSTLCDEHYAERHR